MNPNFILRQIADEYLLIPVGEAAQKIKGLISLTESGYLLYQSLQNGATKEALVDLLLQEYEVSETVARADVDAFLGKMRFLGLLEEFEA